MGFAVEISAEQVAVQLSGWDRIMNWRRSLSVDRSYIVTVGVHERAALERSITHRVLGVGTHDGERRPNGRRVGTMLGHGLAGNQFWAVARSDASAPVVVVDLTGHDFIRLVLMVENPDATAAELSK